MLLRALHYGLPVSKVLQSSFERGQSIVLVHRNALAIAGDGASGIRQ
jgi:hypothetical protein